MLGYIEDEYVCQFLDISYNTLVEMIENCVIKDVIKTDRFYISNSEMKKLLKQNRKKEIEEKLCK